MPTPALTQPATRVSRTGTAMRKPATGALVLTKRQLAMIEFMVHGIPCAFPRHPHIEPHVALSTNDAADCAGIRRKNARDLMLQPVFSKAYHAELAAHRSGEYGRSLSTLVTVRDDPGSGKAADRKVQMGAALAILGEQAKGTTVNVQVNNTSIQPGIVVRRFEQQRDERTIEHQST